MAIIEANNRLYGFEKPVPNPAYTWSFRMPRNNIVLTEPTHDSPILLRESGNDINFSLVSMINSISDDFEYCITGSELRQIFICYNMEDFNGICMMLNSAVKNRIKESYSKVEEQMDKADREIQPIKNQNYSWFLDNFNNLKSHYYGQWIAISEQCIVSHNLNHKEVIKEVKKLNIRRPLIIKVVESWE